MSMNIAVEGAQEPERVRAEATDEPTGRRIKASDPRYMEILDFMWEEAAALDRHDHLAWKAMLDPAVRYVMPVCITRRRGTGEAYATEAVHFDEDYHSLSFRIRRIEETLAWAMDPAPRARRFVTTIRAWETPQPDVFDVTSSLLLHRTAEDDFQTDVITAQRLDQVRATAEGGYLLLSRRIIADQSTIGTHNLAVFL